MTLVPIPALSSALQGLRSSQRRFDRAAEAVARAAIPVPPEPPEDPSSPQPAMPEPGQPTDLTGSMTDILMAQRGYFAQLRLIEAAQKMHKEAIDLGLEGE